MPNCTLLFVHGTGVRNASYGVTLDEVRAKVSEFKLPVQRVEPLLWGDVLGVEFEGKSLPEPLHRTRQQEEQALRWEYLRVDPLFDLKLWCTPGLRDAAFGDYTGRKLWEKTISTYTPGPELTKLLELNGLDGLFTPAWRKVVESGLPEKAFGSAGSESASVARVYAEAVTAQMMQDGSNAQPPVPLPASLALKIVERLLFDWNQMVRAFKDILNKVLGVATKQIIRPLRSSASRAVAPAIGDILHYLQVQNGRDLRDLIRKKISLLDGDVFILSHSLGGIACVEAMAETRPGNVRGLITAGSQAPLLHEFGALCTLAGNNGLPAHFPPWLNLYDENDLLSYRADPVFGCTADMQVDSMLPPLEAHSGYWKLDTAWTAMKEFMEQHA